MKTDHFSFTQSKEQKLLQQIADAKQKLEKLQHQKTIHYGTLLMKYGLDKVQPSVLEVALSQLASELLHASE